MSGLKNLKKNDILFRENDPSESMYVIKSGKIAITKSKGSSEITLAELGPGDMLGEMAFFDNKPRSAGAKAVQDSVLIELPFKSLNAQFKTFPEWLKAIVRTVNTHLRNANTKIKNLEKAGEEETVYFPPHTATRLVGILGLVASRYGEKTPEGLVVSQHTLRRYTIQVFQMPTAKMERMMALLESMGYMKVEDLGEGKQKITVFNADFLVRFCDVYTEWLFKPEEKRVEIEEKELKPMKALVFYGNRETPNHKGEVKVNLTTMQADAMKDLNFAFSTDDVNSLAEKKVISEKMSIEGGIAVSFHLKELEAMHPIWELVYACKKVQRP